MKMVWNDMRTELELKDFDKTEKLKTYMRKLNKNIKFIRNKVINLCDAVRILGELDLLYEDEVITCEERGELCN